MRTEGMSDIDYFRDDEGSDAARRGRSIYRTALAGRRGFRPDQIGIPEDDEVWLDIFEAIGFAANETE